MYNRQSHNPTIPQSHNHTTILIETHGDTSEDIAIIHNAFHTHTHITLVTPGYKVASWMSTLLTHNNIENMVAITTNTWCSVLYIRELLNNNVSLERKQMILLLKVSYWLTETNTGLLDEMKFYGEERNMIDRYRCREDETHIWRQAYESNVKNIPILIVDAYQHTNTDTTRYPIIKDIPLLEEIIRRRESQEISFDTLYEAISTLTLSDERIHMADMISMIRNIYESTPERPTGPLISPPGVHGETYFITQSMLWHRGYRWLVHATETLDYIWKIWKREYIGSQTSRDTISTIAYIDRCISTLVHYHKIQDNNRNIILNISSEKTKITIIPRNIKTTIQKLLYNSTAYGVSISGPETRDFLWREYGFDATQEIMEPHEDRVTLLTQGSHNMPHIHHVEYHARMIQPGTVILTTSQKHARDLGQELRKLHGKNIEVLIQGLSGGKGKMLSTFKHGLVRTILIGIIDTWRDEYDLWKIAKHIIIARIPFDPPTDPYFLARSIGMSNNFAEYSQPIVTIRLNTLIARIRESTYAGSIGICDSRLTETEWGKKIGRELL